MVHALGQIIEKLGIMQIVFVTERQRRRRGQEEAGGGGNERKRKENKMK